MSFDQAELRLYTFFRSTSSARVRTAAKVKGIDLSFVYINVRRNEQLDDDFKNLNPNGTVPVLTVTPRSNDLKEDSTFAIRQSIPILEFFEEAFPDRNPLLPPLTDWAGRSHVRDLVNIIACDIQPPTNRRILLKIEAQGGSLKQWAFDIMDQGMQTFEQTAAPLAGRFSYRNQLTMADVVLAPAVENAIRYGVDLARYPTIQRVFETIRNLDEFKSADWRHQQDTPAEEIQS